MKFAVSFFILLLMAPLAGCPRKSPQKVPSNSSQREISRERAIEIARSHVKFQPKSINAEKATENGRSVWRVTFRGEPVGQVSVMGEIMIISIDRFTGEIVSIAQS
jgi:predicted small lipoprotein YifL